MNKRFLLFAGIRGHSDGGLHDLEITADSLEELFGSRLWYFEKGTDYWFHVYDTKLNFIVFEQPYRIVNEN